MKLELFPFQRRALEELRSKTTIAQQIYKQMKVPQVISFTAPTGSGKTIIMTALFESILYGDETYPEQENAIIVWLSDSPELNEQSKQKIDTKSDKINLNQVELINDDSFDQEMLDDGKIYFINTQKLGRSSNLTKTGDHRQYSIWDTFTRTIINKSDRLYFVIDEAHRGMKEDEQDKATTIMQKFIKGSPEDYNMPPAPVVVGMSATVERFNNLVTGTNSTIHQVAVLPDEVKASGLLKERIVVSYPEESTKNNDMAVLSAATLEWRDKWEHWDQYCKEQHYQQVYPIFVIQVRNGDENKISETNLDEILEKIENTSGFQFKQGEVVHSFGEMSDLEINGLLVKYINPSDITDNRRVKIVFFKESLSTGWDCPRAETMISFRSAQDTTYITQLLGRMVRTPLQMRVQVDETLNDVHLYLPYFNRTHVEEVVERFQTTEGNESMASDIYGDSIESSSYTTWTANVPINTLTTNQSSKAEKNNGKSIDEIPYDGSSSVTTDSSDDEASPVVEPTSVINELFTPKNEDDSEISNDEQIKEDEIDRKGVIRYINESGLLTYKIRKIKVVDSYLKSVFKLARFLMMTRLSDEALPKLYKDIVQKIIDYIDNLKKKSIYDENIDMISKFNVLSQSFEMYGDSENVQLTIDSFDSTQADIDNKLRAAERRLGNEGVSNKYLNEVFDQDDIDILKLNVILYAMDDNNIVELEYYAQETFHYLHDSYRRETVLLEEKYQTEYDRIVSNAEEITAINFKLPETIKVKTNSEGIKYKDHLFVDNTTKAAKIKLNPWEHSVLEEERKKPGFITWLRNEDRKSWSLCVPYKIDGETKGSYPDLLIVREEEDGYVVDLLEPHQPNLDDNLSKAKGFAEYARKNHGLGRIELIRIPKKDIRSITRFKRLNLSKSSIQEKVLKATTSSELDHIFETDGYFY